MVFYIQAGSPGTQGIISNNDETLSDAIESTFLPNTENAMMAWNHIYVPLSYKYDISYMMGDLLKLLNCLQKEESGEIIIRWLPDTFRCDWWITWNRGQMEIQSYWECTVGHLERLLNDCSRISVLVKHFTSEWREVLYNVISGLQKCGYHENKIMGMSQLYEQFKCIENTGILYRERGKLEEKWDGLQTGPGDHEKAQ